MNIYIINLAFSPSLNKYIYFNNQFQSEICQERATSFERMRRPKSVKQIIIGDWLYTTSIEIWGFFFSDGGGVD